MAKLILASQMKKLLANGAKTVEADERGADTPDHVPVVKIFNPYGSQTWLLSEIDPLDPVRAFGLADLGMGEPELGWICLPELVSWKNRMGLGFERDMYVTLDKRISEYAGAARKAGRIEA
ncbi:DUF2958 domain-containing protein [Poseidonocella sp. HB161398]|uniref:DUF2958 domain-containing protein n=1 Tax=Poseidonocella sp. HB161398 TaxID=2320855 RepID=UPI001107D55A|nr:DUF2958 domain-containing protein [Poseidonocella sp. HB161398]